MSKTCTCNRDDIGDIGHDLECPVLTTKEVEGWGTFEERAMLIELQQKWPRLLTHIRSQIIKELCEKVEQVGKMDRKRAWNSYNEGYDECLDRLQDLLTHLKEDYKN